MSVVKNVLVCVISVNMCGCGTAAVFLAADDRTYEANEGAVYSGVKRDVATVTLSHEAGASRLGWRVLSALDIPLSALADTICLPYTIYRAATHKSPDWGEIKASP